MPDPRANPIAALAKIAAALAGAEEGIACKGTAVESRTYKLGGKAFLFLRRGNAMVRLRGSLPEAQRLSSEQPSTFRAGSGGWTTIKWQDGDALPMALLARWIAESHKGYAEEPGPRASVRKKAPRKKAAKKRGTARAKPPHTTTTRRR